MSKYIFFDLETTDLNFTGQILQFSFSLVSDNENHYYVLDKLSGTISLSRTQLPNPDAIVATDIDINDHLEILDEHRHENKSLFLKNFNERDSLNIIKEWIEEKCLREKIYLIGHNSTNFDVPYLRTSMIRNGINPYFNKNLEYLDTKNILKKLYCENEQFKKLLHEKGNLSKPFSLQNIANILDYNDNCQTHQAWDDVDLLIEICNKIKNKFNCHLYKSSFYINNESPENRLDLKDFVYFDYKNNEDGTASLLGEKTKPVLLYNSIRGGKYYFFLDVEKALELYKKDKEYTLDDARKLLIWKKTPGNFCLVNKSDDTLNKKTKEKLKTILNELDKLVISMENYFLKKICDVEQHIYMMDYHAMNQLITAIEEFDTHGKVYTKPTSLYANKLLTRFKLNNLKNYDEPNFKAVFEMYFNYRYNDGSVYSDSPRPRMIVDRFKTAYDNIILEESFHPKLSDYYQRIEELREEYKQNPHKTQILENLLVYFKNFQKKYDCGDKK